ncbi:J domain-containing protein [Streptobacillus canis]|uniref:J domain-containing protein n=1 Tax=Streptobacillus canis TaxID=2678686 RepID=UPI0012E27E36|nr:J domain-containing protein [Streptobacillus canis]
MRNILAILFGLLAMAFLSKNNNSGLPGLLIRFMIVVLSIVFFVPLLIIIVSIIAIGYIIMRLTGAKINTTTYTNEDFYNYYNSQNRDYSGYNQYNQYTQTYTSSQDEYKKACEYLGVNPSDSFDIKKKARNTILKKNHPDFFQDEKEKERATEITNKINNAWDIIERYEGVK